MWFQKANARSVSSQETLLSGSVLRCDVVLLFSVVRCVFDSVPGCAKHWHTQAHICIHRLTLSFTITYITLD